MGGQIKMIEHRKVERHGLTLMVIAVAAMTLASCTAKTPPPPPAVAAPPPPIAPVVPVTQPVVAPPPVKLSRHQESVNVLAALNQGNSGSARAQVVAILAERPDDAFAKDILKQLDTDPKILLGDRSFPYQIRKKETLSAIAARYLGNPNRFWALARYNNIAVPSTAGAGQTIQIPGVAPAAPVIRAKPDATTAVKAATPAAAAERSATPRVDTAGANRLRRAGLDEMARGSIDKAVPLLERALALDPGNATIQADLAQARKVQKAVRQN